MISARRILQHLVHFARGHIIDHMGILAHEFLDPLLVLFCRFLDAGADKFESCFLQGSKNRPGFDTASDEQNLLALETRLIGRDGGPSPRLFTRDDGFSPAHQLIWRATFDQETRNLTKGIA